MKGLVDERDKNSMIMWIKTYLTTFDVQQMSTKIKLKYNVKTSI